MTADDRKLEYEQAIRRAVPRQLFVEVKEQFEIAAEQASAAVKKSDLTVTNGVPLSPRRQSKAIGLVRHQILDQVFEELITRHGGTMVNCVELDIPVGVRKSKSLPIHLTTGVFGETLLGFASHRELQDAPIKNATRKALCQLNFGLSDDLFKSREVFSDRQRFVVIMVQRDAFELGKIASISICILNSQAEQFIYQSDINEFLDGYGARPTTKKKTGPKLRNVSATFKEARDGREKSKKMKEE